MVRPEWRRLRPGPRAGRRWPARGVRERGGSRPRRARRPGPLPRRSREPSRSPPRRPRRRRPGERAERAASSASLANGDERPQTLAPDTPQAAHAAEIVHRRKTAALVTGRDDALREPWPDTGQTREVVHAGLVEDGEEEAQLRPRVEHAQTIRTPSHATLESKKSDAQRPLRASAPRA